jgi:hypothetical protein
MDRPTIAGAQGVVQTASSFLRTVALLLFVGLLAAWSWFAYDKLRERERELQDKQQEIGQLTEMVSEREKRIGGLETTLAERERRIENQRLEIARLQERVQQLEIALKLSKTDHRLATLEVLSQEPAQDDPGQTLTRVRFQELDLAGNALGEARTLEVSGKLLYVETLVIKFADEYVERGDALRGTSVCFFRRLFGDQQKPEEGTSLDPAGGLPRAYASDDGSDTAVSALRTELFQRFWDYANEPAVAETLGVRALHGEAPFIEARAGKTYVLELRAAGGLSIHAR